MSKERLSHTEISHAPETASARESTWRKKILSVDFDGVIHDYTKGWDDGSIYGNVTKGFWEWVIAVAPYFKLVVVSSRAKSRRDVSDMIHWFEDQWQLWLRANNTVMPMPDLEIWSEKPPAWATIDDRAIRFEGRWSDPALSVEALKDFKPWMLRDEPLPSR